MKAKLRDIFGFSALAKEVTDTLRFILEQGSINLVGNSINSLLYRLKINAQPNNAIRQFFLLFVRHRVPGKLFN